MKIKKLKPFEKVNQLSTNDMKSLLGGKRPPKTQETTRKYLTCDPVPDTITEIIRDSQDINVIIEPTDTEPSTSSTTSLS